MKTKEKDVEERKKRKLNIKIFPIYNMLGLDFIFYYAIQVLFLTQLKGISVSEIVLAGSAYAFTSIVVQIPALVFVDKVGKSKSLLIGNIINTLCILTVIFCPNFLTFLIEECVTAIAFALKGITESCILNDSIPECTNKNEIFSSINAKGYSKYCYVAAVSSILAGVLYDINPYIPMILCFICSLLATLISANFSDIRLEEQNEKEKTKGNFKEYIKNLKESFSFIFNSKRLRALLFSVGFLWGIICLFNTYKVDLLDQIGVSATVIGIFDALYQVFVGIASKTAVETNRKYRNKTLTVIRSMEFTKFCNMWFGGFI